MLIILVSFSLSLLLSPNFKKYQEMFSLKWKYFIPNLSSSLSDLFTENSYSDVTLVSDDKIPFLAHKYVLSASSPVLKTILLDNPHSHPLIYLRGVNHQELESILQFIYLGSSLYHGNMNRFLQTAKDLQIKQLVESVLSRNSLSGQAQTARGHNETINNGDTSNQGILSDSEVLNDRQSVSSIADELINLNIPSYNPGSDELGSGKHLYM